MTKSQLKNLVDQNINDNSSQEITPERHREVEKAIIDALYKLSENLDVDDNNLENVNGIQLSDQDLKDLSNNDKVLSTDDEGNIIAVDNEGGSGGGELEKVTEGGNTGWRLKGEGDGKDNIGENAVDMSIGGKGASGKESFAEGYNTESSGKRSHAEGKDTKASGAYSHAEGHSTEATSLHSHAEGKETEAINEMAHAEGYGTKASGKWSHAEGKSTEARGDTSHVQGHYTRAKSYAEFAAGIYNDSPSPNSANSWDNDDLLASWGGGTSVSERKNLLELWKNGKLEVKENDLVMNSNKITDLAKPTNDHDAATKKYVDDNSGSGGGGIDKVEDDSSPKLGGDLDANEHKIENLKDGENEQDAVNFRQLSMFGFEDVDVNQSGEIKIDVKKYAFFRIELEDDKTFYFNHIKPNTATAVSLHVSGDYDFDFDSNRLNNIYEIGDIDYDKEGTLLNIIIRFITDPGYDLYISQTPLNKV